jgi:hypothetical protein
MPLEIALMLDPLPEVRLYSYKSVIDHVMICI